MKISEVGKGKERGEKKTGGEKRGGGETTEGEGRGGGILSAHRHIEGTRTLKVVGGDPLADNNNTTTGGFIPHTWAAHLNSSLNVSAFVS